MSCPNLTAANLASFTGTTQLFYDQFLSRVVKYTDGVKFLRDNGANWFAFEVISRLTQKHGFADFVTVKMTVKNNSAVISFTDGNGNKVSTSRHIEYTDFPLPEITLFYTGQVLMLASEY